MALCRIPDLNSEPSRKDCLQYGMEYGNACVMARVTMLFALFVFSLGISYFARFGMTEVGRAVFLTSIGMGGLFAAAYGMYQVDQARRRTNTRVFIREDCFLKMHLLVEEIKRTPSNENILEFGRQYILYHSLVKTFIMIAICSIFAGIIAIKHVGTGWSYKIAFSVTAASIMGAIALLHYISLKKEEVNKKAHVEDEIFFTKTLGHCLERC